MTELKTRKQHLKELRNEIIKMVVPLIICFGIFFTFAKQIVNFILDYYQIPLESVVSLNPFESLQTSFSIAGGLTLLFCLPLILNAILRYSKEAISENAYKKLKGLIWRSYMITLLGTVLGVFIFSKLILINLMSSYTLTTASWGIFTVFSLIITLSITLALTMQMILIIPATVNIGLIEKESLKVFRPFAIIGILIASAIATPPDVFSMFLMSVPIYGAFEIGILLSKSKKEEKIC
jgi:sec-independent protein translocase protein TatC